MSFRHLSQTAITLFLCLSFLYPCLVRGEIPDLPPSFFSGRREALRKLMPENSLAVLFTAPERTRSNDTKYPYHQAPDFYYFTGFSEPNAVLVIRKNSASAAVSGAGDILFIPPPGDPEEKWTGKRISAHEASLASGIQTVLTTPDFLTMDFHWKNAGKVLYLKFPEGMEQTRRDTLELADLVEHFKNSSGYPATNGDDYFLGKFLKILRERKEPEELALLKESVRISSDAHLEMMRDLIPGMKEYQVQAAGEFVFKNEGAAAPGYNSICGSGPNSCILHYEKNSRTALDGDLILLDMGAEFRGYSADITRTLPVNGLFTKDQAILYDLVLNAQKAGIKACRAGNSFRDPHNAAFEVIRKGLLELGILTAGEDAGRYFPHGTSQYLGLDVHDAGTYGSLQPNSVITVEPGIYIPQNSPCDPRWWNIGIRIEDDILITAGEPVNLSASLPSDRSSIEKIMEENGTSLHQD
ncbi:MAG: aminopeptidase P family protein [Bacteroidia bacterium]|nr:aminopeptidase P family protein [Bacteroidia bacterium]